MITLIFLLRRLTPVFSESNFASRLGWHKVGPAHVADTPAACVYRFLTLKFCSLKIGVISECQTFSWVQMSI